MRRNETIDDLLAYIFNKRLVTMHVIGCTLDGHD